MLSLDTGLMTAHCAALLAVIFVAVGVVLGRQVFGRVPWWALAATVCLGVGVFGWHQAMLQQPSCVAAGAYSDHYRQIDSDCQRAAVVSTFVAWPLAFTGTFLAILCFVRSMDEYVTEK